MYSRYLIYLIIVLFIKAVAILGVILYSGIGLSPDEAQYWTWSQQLDWGYYSKPPGIAWQIWFSTFFLGATELGVRAGALLLGSLIPIAIYFLARACRLSPQTCFWSGASFALAPMGIFSSLLAITDGGMVLFWTLALAYLVSCIEEKQVPSYLLLGVCIGAAALFKWPAYSMWACVLAAWFFFPWLRSARVVVGILTSLIALLPSFYWNATHDWATFRHVSSTLSGGHAPAKSGAWIQGNPLDFLGSQFALASPIFFVFIAIGLFALISRYREPKGLLFTGAVAAVLLGGALILSFFMKLQGNWVIFAYPAAFVVLAWYVNSIWLLLGTALSLLLSIFVLSIPALQQRTSLPYRMSPFKHNVGWTRLQEGLKSAGYDPSHDFLFSDKYQTASILSFYGPHQQQAFFFNLQGSRKNQFSYWPKPKTGSDGYFVAVENVPQLTQDQPAQIKKYLELLAPYFETVTYIGEFPLFKANGQEVKGAMIFQGKNYQGTLPKDPELY